MVFAIEPMITAGSHDIHLDDDGWSIYTVDGSMSAHFEHTVAVTADGPLILTLGPDGTSVVDRPV
jgi:methionyl aminopeptidase